MGSEEAHVVVVLLRGRIVVAIIVPKTIVAPLTLVLFLLFYACTAPVFQYYCLDITGQEVF